MLIEFFFTLRKFGVPVSLRELLDLLRALQQQVVFADLEGFYVLARSVWVKDESLYDKYDRAFAYYFEGVEQVQLFDESISEEWLRQQFQRVLSEADKKLLKSLGGLEPLLDTLRQRLEEQKRRHEGGNRWVGTGGTSPFGQGGYHPEGVRIGEEASSQRRAVKVWKQRHFRNLDRDVELGTRNLKVVLRKLRQFARSGAASELDIDATVRSTADNAGYLDLQMVPERHNAVKVLMFFDVGGSMDDHVQAVEELFSAVHTEFKHLEYFYFHNCVYDVVWRDNRRRHNETIDVHQLLRTYGRDYKLVFVGDATMGPYEITYPGGSVESWNHEPGETWIRRLTEQWPKHIWLNPQPPRMWKHYSSINIMRRLMSDRMFALTPEGVARGVSALL